MPPNPRKRSGNDWKQLRADKRARRTEDLAAAGLELSPDGRVKPLGDVDGTSADDIIAKLTPEQLKNLTLGPYAAAAVPVPTSPEEAAAAAAERAAALAALPADAALDAVTPYWRLPYSTQLTRKRKDVVKALRRVLRETRAQFSRPGPSAKAAGSAGVTPDLPYAGPGHRDIVCPLGLVTPSPQLDAYRNKNEFTFGLDPQGAIRAGFQLARFNDGGETRVGSPAGCRSAPSAALAVAELLTEFARTQDDLGVWDKVRHSGFYRLLTVRTSEPLGQMLVVVQVSPGAVGGADSERFAKFKKDLTEFVVSRCYGGALSEDLVAAHNAADPASPWAVPPVALAGPADAPEATEAGIAFAKEHGVSLTALAVEIYDGISNAAGDDGVVVPLFGNQGGYIHDILSGLVFRVDYKSFFQVNPRGAEGLYAKATQWALAPPHDWSLGLEGVMQRYVCPPVKEAQAWVDKIEEIFKEKRAAAASAAAAAAAESADKAETEADAAETKDGEASPTAAGSAAAAEGGNDDEDAISDTSPTSLAGLMRAALAPSPVAPLPETADPDRVARTLVLDVCCGTGTIGLTVAKHVKRVVGLELVPQAVEDAKANAALNSVTNAEFVCGRAETTIKQVLASCADDMDMAVAIVDPPRSGLHNDVVAALRNSKLNRIVYVSCNPATLADNVQRLAGPVSKRYSGRAFVPVAAQAVDMFPHTSHCELIMLLERRPEEAGAVAEKVEAETADA